MAETVRGSQPGRSAGSNILTTLAGNLAPPLAALVTAPILAHSLGLYGRGQVAAATAPYFLLATVASFGIPEAVTYVVAKKPKFAGYVLRFALSLMIVLGLISIAAVYLVASWLSAGDDATTHLIELACLATAPALCIGVLRGCASALNLWFAVARERAVVGGMRVTVIAVLGLGGWLSPFSATLALAVSPLCGGLSYVGLRIRLQSEKTVAVGEVRPRFLVTYGARVWVGSMAGVLLMRLDQTIMLPMTGAAELGKYVVAVTVAEVPLIINSAFRDVMFASEASQHDNARLLSASRLSTFSCVAVSVPLAALTPWLIPFLFGGEFTGAVTSTLILILGVIVSTHGSVAGAGLSGRGRPGLRSGALFLACLVNVGLLISLVPKFGAVGAALATLGGNLVFTLVCICAVSRVYGLEPAAFLGVRHSDLGLFRVQIRNAITRARLVRDRRGG